MGNNLISTTTDMVQKKKWELIVIHELSIIFYKKKIQ